MLDNFFYFLPKKAPEVIKRGFSKFWKKFLALASLKLPSKKTYQILGGVSLNIFREKVQIVHFWQKRKSKKGPKKWVRQNFWKIFFAKNVLGNF